MFFFHAGPRLLLTKKGSHRFKEPISKSLYHKDELIYIKDFGAPTLLPKKDELFSIQDFPGPRIHELKIIHVVLK